jgi:hypothetical protein
MGAVKLPAWVGDVAKQAGGNALGTHIAALLIFLGGVIGGAISDVSTGTVVAALSTLVAAMATVIYAYAASREAREAAEAQAAREAKDRHDLEVLLRKLVERRLWRTSATDGLMTSWPREPGTR